MASGVPRLIVFSDTTRVAVEVMLERYTALAERAAADTVQFTLRDYSLPVRERWALAEQLATLTTRTQQRFGIAERADLARLLRCQAFHLPGTGLRAAEARSYLGAQVMLSGGCHDPSAAVESELDAVLLSPIFESRKGRPALGVAALESARARQPRHAWFALGGVAAGNAATCLTVGASGVAVIGAALEANPEPLLGALGILRG